MIVKSYQLSAHCRSPAAANVRALLCYGANGGLVNECGAAWACHRLSLPSDGLAAVIKDPMRFSSCRASEVANMDDWLATEACMPTLIGEARLVVIDGAEGGEANLVRALKNHLDRLLHPVLIKADALSVRSPLRQLFERDKEHLVAIACYEDSPRTLTTVLQEHAARHNKKIAPEALAQLLARKKDDRRALLSLLDMVMLYDLEADVIDEAAVVECASLHGGEDVALERLPHALMLGQWRDASAHSLTKDDHVRLVRYILAHFRRLHEGYLLLAQGMDYDAMMRSLSPPVFFKLQKAMERQWRIWNIDALPPLFARWLALEEQLKSHPPSWGALAVRQLMLETVLQAKNFRRSRSAKSY